MTTMDKVMRRPGRFLIGRIDAKGAAVSIYEVAAGLNVADVVTAYEVTTSTGYCAVLPACFCEREPCAARNCRETFKHCHGPFGSRHEVHVRTFAVEVAATYGSAGKGRTDPSQGRAHLHNTYLYNGRVPQLSTHGWAATEWAQRMERQVAENRLATYRQWAGAHIYLLFTEPEDHPGGDNHA